MANHLISRLSKAIRRQDSETFYIPSQKFLSRNIKLITEYAYDPRGMSLTNRTRIGIVGCGIQGLSHLQTLSEMVRSRLLDIDIRGAFDTDSERLKVLSRIDPELRLYEDASSMIKDIDVVFICTPTKFHIDYLEVAADAGKDIFCEKPMATNLAGAKKMLNIVEKAGVKAQVGLSMRFDPILNYTKHLIDTNKERIEFPICFLMRDDQCFPTRGGHPTQWRKYKDLTGGGALIEHSIHDIDIMRWFFGDIEEVRATSRNYSDHEVEDEDTVWLKFENGSEGTLTSIWHEMVLRNSNRLMEIFYYKGLFHLEIDDGPGFKPPPFYTLGDEPPIKIEYKKASDYLKEKLGIQSRYDLGELTYQDYAFLKSIQNGKRPEIDFSVGVYAHKVVEAAYISAKDGSRIKLALDNTQR
jgi:predicted dehydrogenase